MAKKNERKKCNHEWKYVELYLNSIKEGATAVRSCKKCDLVQGLKLAWKELK